MYGTLIACGLIMAKVNSKWADVIKVTCKKHIEKILASFQEYRKSSYLFKISLLRKRLRVNSINPNILVASSNITLNSLSTKDTQLNKSSLVHTRCVYAEYINCNHYR